MNTNYWGKNNCRSLFTRVEYIPNAYFFKPLDKRIFDVYCKVESINYVSGIIELTAYSHETHEVDSFIEITFDDLNPFEMKFLSYSFNLIILFRVGEFIEYKHNQFSIKEDLRIDINPTLRNYKYYENAIQKQVDKFNKVFGND